MITILISIALLLIGIVIGLVSLWIYSKSSLTSAEQRAARVISDAKLQAETLNKEYLYEAREQLQKEKKEHNNEVREAQRELNQLKFRLQKREDQIEEKLSRLEQQQREVLDNKEKIKQRESELEKERNEIIHKLESIARLTAEEARKLLIEQVTASAKQQMQFLTHKIEQDAVQSAERRGKELIVMAAQRLASEVSAEATISTVILPNEEMKGRVIGKDGRNIRSIETLTGADIIIDDTPEAVIVSCFNPVRRAIAVQTLSNLVKDGRIHPAKIEEEVIKVTQNLNKVVYEEGEKAFLDLGLHGSMHSDGLCAIGRLKFRTSYGQNVLNHSKEVASIAGILAKEIGIANVDIAKRGALLHDVGKSMDSNVSLSHVELGVDLAKRINESPEVINCIAAHHGDVPHTCIESVIVQTADAISASRPGARRDTLESYIERLEKLEAMTADIPGIQNTYALHAGRELRVIIKSDEVSDSEVLNIAKSICQRIEENLKHPGRIKVVAIREQRIIEYAR